MDEVYLVVFALKSLITGLNSRHRSRLIKFSSLALWIIIFAGALLIRLYGIDFGLPYLYEPDEPTFVSVAMRMFEEQDLNPHWFQNPGTTTLYSLLAVFSLLYAGGWLLGDFHDPEAFVELFHRDPSLAYMSGRLLILAFSMACLFLVYLIAKRIYDRWTALLASAIFAFSPLAVEYSRIIRIDVQLTLFSLIAFWFCLNILERGRWRDYMLAGLALGWAVVTKYPGAFFIPILILAHFISRPFNWHEQWKLMAAVLTCAAGFLIGSPYMIIEYQTVISGFIIENRTTHLSATGSGFFNNLIWYLGHMMPRSFSVLGVLLLIPGIITSLMSEKKARWLMAACPVLFLVLLSFLHLRWERWAIPVLPFASILIATGAINTSVLIRKYFHSPGWASLVIIVVCILLLGISMQKDLRLGRALAGADTRTLGREWILENIPADSRLLMEVYTPQLPREDYIYFVVIGDQIQQVDIEHYPETVFRPIWAWTNPIGTLGDANQICQLEADRYPEIINTYRNIFGLGTVVQEFLPLDGITPGPHLQVIRVENCG